MFSFIHVKAFEKRRMTVLVIVMISRVAPLVLIYGRRRRRCVVKKFLDIDTVNQRNKNHLSVKKNHQPLYETVNL